MFACRAWTTVGPTSGIIASAAAAKRRATSRSLSPGRVRVRITSSRLASAIRAVPIPIVRATCSIPSSGQAGVEEGLHPPRRFEVGLGAARLVGVGVGNAEGGAEAPQLLEVDADGLGDLARRVAAARPGQGPLDRQQRQPPGGDRFAAAPPAGRLRRRAPRAGPAAPRARLPSSSSSSPSASKSISAPPRPFFASIGCVVPLSYSWTKEPRTRRMRRRRRGGGRRRR